MASIHGGSGNELFFHGSTFPNGDGAKIDLDSATAKYYVCAITIINDAKFQVLGILDGGVNSGLGNTHFGPSTDDTQTIDADWGGETAETDNDQTIYTAGSGGVEFKAGTTIYGMWDNVELHAGAVVCYVAPRPDYNSRAAAI